MRNLKAQHLHEIPLFPGVPEMLLTLAGHSVTLALVSSDREANVRRQLGAPVAALFQHFECGASLFGKAAKFNRVTKSAGLAPHQVVSIGDEVRDIDAARAEVARIKTVLDDMKLKAPRRVRIQYKLAQAGEDKLRTVFADDGALEHLVMARQAQQPDLV